MAFLKNGGVTLKKILFILAMVFCLIGIKILSDLNTGSFAEKNNILNKCKIPAPIEPNNDIKKEIIIKPSKSIKQGQTVFIEVKTAKNLENPRFSFKKKIIKLYKVKNNNYKGILGIWALEKTGKASIYLKDDTGNLNDKITLNILPSKFPSQNIVIRGKKSKLRASTSELRLIGKAKKVNTPIAYWHIPPFNSPTKGCIISPFGLSRYHNGKFTGSYHKGVDIKAPNGREVRTVAGGKVLIAKSFNLHGKTVAINHGKGLMSIYIHLSQINVKEGDLLKADHIIGKVGSSGFATGPHLHWGLYVNGTPVNPMQSWVKYVPLCK